MAAAKPRKRIVAQLVISPTSGDRPQELTEDPATEVAPVAAEKQRDQSAWAKEHLGAERKVFVDLTDTANKEVNWRQLLKERGVQKPAKAAQPADGAAGNDALLLRGRSGRQENTWTKMISKLEATFCMGAGSEEEEESDGWSDEGSDSDAEEEGGEGDGKKDGSDGDAGDGATTGGEGGGGKKDGGKKGKKQEGGYDYFDEFIDDEEFLELLQHDKRKPKHTGFFINKGEIERTEEMLPGYEELAGGGKKSGKRKAEGEEAGAEGAAAPPPAAKEAKSSGAVAAAAAGEKKKKRKAADAGEGGASQSGAESDKPAKKKKRAVPEAVGATAAAQTAAAAAAAQPTAAAAAPTSAAPTVPPTRPAGLSIAEQARMAGQMAAAGVAPPPVAAPAAQPTAGLASQACSPMPSQQPPSSQAPPPSAAKKKVPYEMPAAVAGALADIKRLAAEQPAPPPPLPGEKARRSLPKALRAAIDGFSLLFLQQEGANGRAATNRIMEELAVLEPFIAKSSLAQRLRNANKDKKQKEAAKTISADQLKALIAAKVQAVPVTSDDDFQTAPPPRNSTSPPGAAGDAAAGSASQAPPAMQAPAAAAQAGKSWKALPKEVQQQVFIFFKERLGAEKFNSVPGKLLLQEVYNWFPPNSITLADLTAIYNTYRVREKKAEAAASVAALAAAGQAMLGQAGLAAAGAQQQQQQQQHGGALDAAEVYAVLAVAAAEKKVVSPAQQQQQQQQGGGAAVSPAPAAQPAVAAPPALAIQKAAIAEGAAAAVADALAAAIQPAATTAAQPTADAAPAPTAGPTAQPPSQALAGPPEGPQTQAPTAPLVSKVSDEECIAKAVKWGAPEALMRELLNKSRSSKYGYVYVRAMMLAGPAGYTTAQVARLAVEHGWQDWDDKGIKAALSRGMNKEHIVPIGHNKFAFKCLPGVVPKIRKPPPVKAGSAAPSGGGVSAEGGSLAADGAPASEAAVDEAPAATEAPLDSAAAASEEA